MTPNRRKLPASALVVACLLAFGSPAAASSPQRLSGIVSRVPDGDSLDITAGGRVYSIRLEGIDAPEAGQAFSREARLHLRLLALTRSVSAVVSDHDRYARIVARVTVGAIDLSEEMIRNGFAWHYARYSPEPRLAELERQARRARRGLWADPKPAAPWDYRAANPRPSSPPAAGRPVGRPRPSPPPAGPYRGNVSSRVYHAPGCRHYDCARCTQAFMSRAAAEAAGFRPHESCVSPRRRLSTRVNTDPGGAVSSTRTAEVEHRAVAAGRLRVIVGASVSTPMRILH
jgi:endonuclease YncB( thermonuclease family)